jgi:ADP-ribose pyrophosphatase YjhB (NUDIX family)
MKTVTTRDIYGHQSQVMVGQLQWSHSAYAVITHKDRILLINQAGGYTLPGGTVNLGEPPEVTVLREVTEETGVTANQPQLLTAVSNFFTWQDPRGGEPEHYQSILFYYTCRYASGAFSKTGHEGHETALKFEPQWLPTDQLKNIKIGSSVNWLSLLSPKMPELQP